MAVEQVSTDILKILGLEETDEIDMQSYKGYLREKLVEISMGKGGLSRDEEMMIREEFKRVKGSTAVKVKKTKVNPQTVFNKGSGGGGGGLVKYRPLVPGSVAKRVIPQQRAVDDSVLNKIYAVVLSIQENLRAEETRRKKGERDRRTKRDREEKAAKESSLEKAAKGIVGALEKTFKPVVDIFKRIRDGLMLLFLGWTINTLLDWIKDPKNTRTFNAIVDFLARNAGKLLLLFVLLNNPLVKAVRWLGRSLISFLVRMIADLTKGKGLLSGLRRGRGRGGRGLLGAAARVVTNPYVAVPLAVTGAAVAANEVTGQRQAAGVQAENKARAQSGQGLGVQGVGGVGDMGRTTPYGSLQGTGMMGEQNLDDGGVVEGPSGIDRVPANLTEGEVVFSKPAVKTFGEDFLLSMNKLGGGTNRPTYSGGRMYAAGGGIVVTSRRGNRVLNGSPDFHEGTDIAAPTGTKLYAFMDGRVQETRKEGVNDSNYGNSVYWTDKDGFGHLYAHLSAFGKGLTAGAEIKKGKILGAVGSTGRSFGPHLHWEMAANPLDVGKPKRTGNRIDPLSKYNYMTPFTGKPAPGDGLDGGTNADPRSNTNHDDGQPETPTPSSGFNFTSVEESKAMSAYINYISQPMGRGLDILPTIDQMSAVPAAPGTPQSSSNAVPGGSATNSSDPRSIGSAAGRQIANPP